MTYNIYRVYTYVYIRGIPSNKKKREENQEEESK